MNNRYLLIDTIFKANTVNEFLRIDSNSSILNIFRIISGTINIKDTYSNKVYKLRNNYIQFPTDKNATISSKSIVNNFPQEIQLKDLNTYFQKSKNNLKFYKSIETELVKCFIAYEESRSLEAFFYLYRIIEGISYAIPLIYVSKKSDYNKTYSDLQSFFGKDKDGELNFFKRFVSETFKDEDFYKSNIDISLLEIEIDDIRNSYYNIYLKKIKEKVIVEKIENESIKIKFIGFYDFLIEIRNRFFHNSKGSWQENLESTEVLFPDVFFKPILTHGINWVSIILFEIIKFDFEKIK